MDKYDQHLNFLIQVIPHQNEANCREIFLNRSKRDLCKALFYALQPSIEQEELQERFLQTQTNQTALQIDLLNKMLHWYCPNASFSKIVGQASRGLPIQLDTAILARLKKFRRIPRKETLQKWFHLVYASNDAVILHFLQRLKSFRHALEPSWASIDNYANSKNVEIAKAALVLLVNMPTGTQKSITTLAKHLKDPKMRFYALSALQQTKGLAPTLLIRLLNPVLTEYRSLMNTKGRVNDLWQEYRLIQSIAQNNGVRLSIPDIGLERF
ncbi:hypothetical protein [Aureispira anguillae]|uniref:Uncharacterized protein n=1 Tax=Aureispira anguillae TaxID=2864201 RepID=A0A916DXL9_9BACT|nr:hypothetical protein [Aureispira anguillae]BDS15206.1 hypothetical protein AsAng_0059900 [Aureispira anguillae]